MLISLHVDVDVDDILLLLLYFVLFGLKLLRYSFGNVRNYFLFSIFICSILYIHFENFQIYFNFFCFFFCSLVFQLVVINIEIFFKNHQEKLATLG